MRPNNGDLEEWLDDAAPNVPKRPRGPHVDHLRPFFHVVAVLSNPVRYESRYRLFKKFAARMHRQKGIHFHIVELQTGLREFVVTDHGNPYHVQVRTEDELWHKENLINLGVASVSRHWPDWKYVAWIDGDIKFHNQNWVDETIQHLQTAHVVQMFSQAVDLGPCGQALSIHQGFMYSYWHGSIFRPGYCNWHPGFAWAMTRHAWDHVGGLIDKAILGSGDRHMAMSLIGKGAESYNHAVHPNYKHMVGSWQKRAEEYIKRDVGYVPGMILHSWHGQKKNRKYSERWQILVKNQYDPYRDVYYDGQGVLRLEDSRIQLRDDIKHYFRERQEDSIDLE